MLRVFTLLTSISMGLWAQTTEPLVLLFAGDVTLSDNVERFVGDKTGYIFERWKPGNDADVFMVNLEHPITTSSERVVKKFNFKMNPSYGSILKDAGVSIVTSANNHIYDYGYAGIHDTMAYLDSLNIPYVGVGKNLADARKPVILDRKGKKIGFLGYYGWGGDFAAGPKTAGYAPRSTGHVVEDVRKLRPKVDLVVVNFHWGTEREALPEEWQVRLGRKTIDAGADVVVGHHPHVLQGIERYRGKIIAYSLGNFVFGGNSLHTYDTGVLKIVLDHDSLHAELLPVSVRHWQPIPAEGKARTRILDLVRERSLGFPDHLFRT